MTLPSLATIARHVFRAQKLRDEHLVVACSGGMDSQVLLHTLAHVASEFSVTLIAVGVDHGLRAEAAIELDLAANLADNCGVRFVRKHVVVDAGSNLQSRARKARYEQLRAVADDVNARFVATAHHLNDRAETVLIRILRGAPIWGLAVLSAASAHRIRPFISVPREAIAAHAKKFDIAFADDPSNRNPRFLRTRVREQVLPLLRTIDPRIDEHLAALAQQAATPSRRKLLEQIRSDVGPLSLRALLALERSIAQNRQGDEVWLPAGRRARFRQSEGIIVDTKKDSKEGGW